MAQEMTWRKAIDKVLVSSATPMHVEMLHNGVEILHPTPQSLRGVQNDLPHKVILKDCELIGQGVA